MNISDIFRLCEDLYNTSDFPLRLAYIYWYIVIAFYLLLHKYEKIHGIEIPRTVKQINYHGTLFIWGALAILFHHGSLKWGWIFHSTVCDKSMFYFLGVAGFLSMSFGLYLVAAARIRLNGYWGIHIYTYEDKYNKLVREGIYSHCRHPIYAG